ncbi:phosphoinositide phospholipase C 6-like isoform X2 [Salvia hispanica]|uniref:phosphoinositide phospholipase C 6-like isoform X2 n=1 Tax=Salvia hispanica TaxID=49212 RepID=UPI0020096616|nr:phosphoinositide phospholipase C 6-like isoform X2 [Salvia hispanica]
MGSYNYYKMFGCFNRKFKISESEPPPDVKEAFWRYSAGAQQMTAEQLLKFMVQHQEEYNCTAVDVAEIMRHVFHRRHHELEVMSLSFTLEDFFYFLFQDDLNGPINPLVHHDMTAPLHHYFIYTGHNSYLTGNQLSSDCSETPIAKALENGVRGIELDLWPNSTKDSVHVLHGRTLTAPVPLFKCFKSIKEHAFVKSPYPVIITLEDHLTPDLQARVAEMAMRIFGDSLYCPESGYAEDFPAVESLKYKIILSTKPPKEYLGSNHSKGGETSSPKYKDFSDDETEAESEADDKLESDSDYEDYDSITSGNVAAPEYKRLIAIHAGNAKNKCLRQVLRVRLDRARRLSLSEQELERAATLYASDVVRFTQKHLLRVFPKGTRVTSSNFSPIIAWMHGAQMVAFNMQGYGKALWTMHGFFRANGGCGYFKKPHLLMSKNSNGDVFDPKLPWPVRLTLKVIVYMGDGWRLDFSHTHFDTYSPPDFYTKVADIHHRCATRRRQV